MRKSAFLSLTIPRLIVCGLLLVFARRVACRRMTKWPSRWRGTCRPKG